MSKQIALVVKLGALLLVVLQIVSMVAADFLGIDLSPETLKALATAAGASSGALFVAAANPRNRQK